MRKFVIVYKMKKFVIVDRKIGEIYLNEFDGTLPPMTEQELVEYFRMPIEKIKVRVKLYPVDEKHLCPHCQTPLTRSDIKCYKWQCWYCDEDFYDIEVIKKIRG